MKSKFKFFRGSKAVFIATIVMVVFGSFMIASAEMGNVAGDAEYLKGEIIKQMWFALGFSVCAYVASLLPLNKLGVFFFWGFYLFVLVLMIYARVAFEPVNGAYAWIRIGNASFQPSELGKCAIILLGARLMAKDYHEKNVSHLIQYALASLIYVFIVFVIQHDLGSAVVIAIIAYCICLVPSYKEYKKIHTVMLIIVFIAIGLFALLLSPPLNNWLLKKFADTDNYQIGRFLAAANPFKFEYDYGYHMIMSLVSFAQGGLIGRGYTNSIHKYMNFPNPSSDFILPVMVEELGILGFIGFIIVYAFMLVPIMSYSFKAKTNYSRIVLFGTFLYFIVHFILNVGGVSGFIPLTGVPLLLLSAGGSAMLSSLLMIGFSQHEIQRIIDENNSGQV